MFYNASKCLNSALPPAIIEAVMQANPQMRAVMESNPEVAQMMRDPAMLRQVSRGIPWALWRAIPI
jgi:hypothetical protein